MLQQTTVEAVIPYYEKFLADFPTVRALAEASEEGVLRRWSGLGYYSRARNLHKAARRVVADFGARLPDTVESLLELPGIGRYTAGAIASIAFAKRAPIVDGNVIRVLSRVYAVAKDPKSSEGRKFFWKKAEDVLPAGSPGDFNQALMELGATVCSPENPSCLLCPIRESCAARKKGRMEDFPAGVRKTRYRTVRMTAALVLREERLLMVQRPAAGLLKGMWEFPMVEGGCETLVKRWPVRILKTLPPVRHSVMDRKLEITPALCRLEENLSKKIASRWVLPKKLSDMPTSSMNHKILKQLEGRDPPINKVYGSILQDIRHPPLPRQSRRLF